MTSFQGIRVHYYGGVSRRDKSVDRRIDIQGPGGLEKPILHRYRVGKYDVSSAYGHYVTTETVITRKAKNKLYSLMKLKNPDR